MALTKFQTSQVEFTQSGTGAQARTVQSKLQDTVNIWDFIPAGTTTSSTNCTPYFQAAVDTGKSVYVPTGTYRLDGTIYLKTSYNSLIGHHNMPTLRMTTENTAIAIRVPDTSNFNEYSRVENFYIVRANSAGSSICPNYRSQGSTVSAIDQLAAVTLQSKTTDGTSSGASTNAIQYTRLSNIRVRNFAVGFYFSECVGVTVHKCFTQVDGFASIVRGNDNVALETTAWSIGYYCDATPISEGSISPLASIEFVECDDNRDGTPTIIQSASYFVYGPDVRDIFWQRCEATKPQYGWYIDAGATNTTAGYDWDLHIFRPVIDAFSINGIYLLNLNGIGAASIVGGYAAPATGGNESIKLNNCNGVTISGGLQIIGNANDDSEDAEDGIRIQSSTRCSVIGNRITNSRYGISLEGSTFCSIIGNIIDAKKLADADSVTLQQAIRVFAYGSNNCDANSIIGNTIAGARTSDGSEANISYTYGIIVAASQTNTTITDNMISTTSVTNRISNSGCTNDVGSELTIASGVITVWDDYHLVDTESDSSPDDLVTINGGQHGQVLILRAANSARTVNVAEGGNISLASSPRALDHTSDTIMLLYEGTTWLELSFTSNA